MKQITLRSPWGFGNRVGFMFGNLLVARTKGYTVKMVWPLNDICSDLFSDYFEPVKDLEIVSVSPEGVEIIDGWFAPQECFSTYLFSELVPKPAIANEVQDFQKPIGDYNAIHVRRTDSVKAFRECWGNRCPTNEYFFSIVEASTLPVFLATDDYDVQQKFIERYGEKILCRPLMPPVKRLTDLQSAVFDLYMCAGSKEFFGTLGSTFSGLISSLQTRQGVNLVYGDTKNWGAPVKF